MVCQKEESGKRTEERQYVIPVELVLAKAGSRNPVLSVIPAPYVIPAKLVLAKAGSRNPEVGSVAGELLFAKKMIWRQGNKVTRKMKIPPTVSPPFKGGD